jgi:hypothetical protein
MSTAGTIHFMRTRLILLTSLLMLCATLHAQQVTIQHGNTLSQLINNLYGGDGIQLANTGHQAHFGQTGDFQNFTAILQSVLQSRSFIPIPSAVGLVSYHFNEATGTYERVEGSLGSILAERGSTTGKGNFNLSATYTFADYETVSGQDTVQLILRHCLAPECTGGAPPTAPFLHDTININLHFRMKSEAVALSAVYGLSNKVDVGIVLPYIRNDLQVFTHAFVVYADPADVAIHKFDPSVETPDQLGTATAIGIGDMVLRGKVRLAPHGGIDSAAMADLTLPTGDRQNFLGTGRVQLRVAYIASKTIRNFTPHLNVGYQARFGDMHLNAFDYRLGTEILASPRVTVSSDILGIYRPRGASLFRSPILENEQLIGRSEIDGTIGMKWKMNTDRALILNLLVPLNTSGVRPNYVLTAGVQMTL